MKLKFKPGRYVTGDYVKAILTIDGLAVGETNASAATRGTRGVYDQSLVLYWDNDACADALEQEFRGASVEQVERRVSKLLAAGSVPSV